MQVSVETTQGLERRLTITVPADKIEKEYNSRLNQVAKTRRIDGFRPGKAPKALIQKMYGEAIVADVALVVDCLGQLHILKQKILFAPI
jgi:trigger factor